MGRKGFCRSVGCKLLNFGLEYKHNKGEHMKQIRKRMALVLTAVIVLTSGTLVSAAEQEPAADGMTEAYDTENVSDDMPFAADEETAETALPEEGGMDAASEETLSDAVDSTVAEEISVETELQAGTSGEDSLQLPEDAADAELSNEDADETVDLAGLPVVAKSYQVLIVGDSLTADAAENLLEVTSDAGYSHVSYTLLTAVSDDRASLAEIWQNRGNDEFFTCSRSKGTDWECQGSVSLAETLKNGKFDLIWFSQGSQWQGVRESYYTDWIGPSASGDEPTDAVPSGGVPDSAEQTEETNTWLSCLASYAAELQDKTPQIGYLMTWAGLPCENAQEVAGEDMEDAEDNNSSDNISDPVTADSENSGASWALEETADAYAEICSAAETAVADDPAVDVIAPLGTVLQNARSSYMDVGYSYDTLLEDAEHLRGVWENIWQLWPWRITAVWTRRI